MAAYVFLYLIASVGMVFAEDAGMIPSHARQDREEPRVITLSDGIRIVLKDSRLLKISLADADMAAAETLISRSTLLPNVNASISEKILNHQPAAKLGGQKAYTGERGSFSYGFDVYQTLFDFGKSLAYYRASQELFSAGKANIEAVRKVAILEFIIAYVNLLETEKMIAVAEKEVESLTAYLHDVEHLYEEGAAVKSDVLPAKVKLADARQKAIFARNQRALANAQLNNILSLPV